MYACQKRKIVKTLKKIITISLIWCLISCLFVFFNFCEKKNTVCNMNSSFFFFFQINKILIINAVTNMLTSAISAPITWPILISGNLFRN